MNRIFLYLSLFVLTACQTYQATSRYLESYPRVDTKSRPIDIQEKRTYSFRSLGLRVDNQFNGARLNSCRQENDSTISILIGPENQPINESPWYAFRIVSKNEQRIWLKLNYSGAKHRYPPKFSSDRVKWIQIENDQVQLAHGDSVAMFPLQLISDTIWVAAQELISSDDNLAWATNLAKQKAVEMKEIGRSALNRPIWTLDIGTGKKKSKPLVILFSRQHPPEITGYLAMQAFVEELLSDIPVMAHYLENFRTLVFPMINPDGVDLGNWRHNYGGIDLNRDWGLYQQPEVRAIADYLIGLSDKYKSPVILGIDFHSTQHDIFYTNSTRPETMILGSFKDTWLAQLDQRIDNYEVNEEVSGIFPVATTKNWFYAQFKAVGITYEVGDNTPRDFIRNKAQVAALIMTELLAGLN